ncbi:MAG: ATP-binding protein [Bdellovibrionales bacterium]|nr:ATP-binding protein [Bdellovibrionales bacterium]
MPTRRILFSKISNLKKSILLLGPRQCGKTTLIRSLEPDLEINLADEETFLQHLRDPGLLRRSLGGHKRIFIDEVQRIPSLLNTTQALIDKDSRLQFFLTGSSARKLRRGKANLLPGRVLTFEMGPLTHEELGADFNLSKALEVGLLPGVYWESSPEVARKTLRTYANTYLKEEIQAEALTRNLEGFSRFFHAIAARSGDTVDFSKIASEAMIERTSARRYFEILVDTLVARPVEAFAKSKRRRLVQHPRFYFFDVGVLNGCMENFQPSPDRVGCLFEHLFLQLLETSARAHDHSYRISFYRTDAGAEVDFIFEREGETFAIEVKASRTVQPHDLRGLASFGEFHGKKHHPLVVYRGDAELNIKGIPVLPLTSALKSLGY